MTADDLVTLALDGAVVAGEREPSSEWRVHVAVYAARPDAGALVHTHSEHAAAWSELGEPLGAWLDGTVRAVGLGRDRARGRGGALGDRDGGAAGRSRRAGARRNAGRRAGGLRGGGARRPAGPRDSVTQRTHSRPWARDP